MKKPYGIEEYVTKRDLEARIRVIEIQLRKAIVSLRASTRSSLNLKAHFQHYLKYRAGRVKENKTYRKNLNNMMYRFRIYEKLEKKILGGGAFFGDVKTRGKIKYKTRLVRLTFTEYHRLMRLLRTKRWSSLHIPEMIGIIR